MTGFEQDKQKEDRLSEYFNNDFLKNIPVQFNLSQEKINSLIREIDFVLKNE